jgi:putative hydrolase
MSESSGEGADFFGRIPLFREFARLLSGPPGPVNWELARQVAVATAAGVDPFGLSGAAELPSPAAPQPGDQHAWDELLRLAELWVDPVTSLDSRGLALTARPVSAPDWAEAVLPAFAPLIEPAARRIGEALGDGGAVPREMGELVSRFGSLVTGMQVGALVGQLARLVLGHYDLALPPPEPARVLLVGDNVRGFEEAGGLPGDQLRLWVACHAVIGQRLLASVPWLDDYLRGVIDEMARAAEPDAQGLIERLQRLDPGRPDDLQDLLGEQGLLGPPSPAMEAAAGRLEVLLALVGGYELVVCERALAGRLPALAAIQAAVAGRLADPEGAAALYATLLRADPERSQARHGERFCREVLAATAIAGLDRLWAHPDFLPTPEELAVPGRWLERVGLVGGDEVDLDEGLRALLEGGGTDDEPDEGGAAPSG